MRPVLFLITIIVLSINISKAQSVFSAKIDSLQNIVDTCSTNNKPKALYELAVAYWPVSQDSTLKLGKETLNSAIATNNKEFECKAYIVLSSVYIFSSTDSAKYYTQKAIDFSTKHGFKDQKLGALCNQGVIFTNLGKKRKAIESYKSALDIAIEVKNTKKEALLYSNIGIAEKELGNFEVAISYIEKSIKIRQEINDRKNLAFSFHMLGVIYYEWDNYKSAEDYFNKALKIREELGDKYGMSFSLNAIGELFQKKEKYDDALKCYKKSLSLSEETGNKLLLSQTYSHLGNVYFSLSQNKNALECYQKSLKIKEELNLIDGLIPVLQNIGNIYYDKKDYINALKYYSKSLDFFNKNEYKVSFFDVYKSLSNTYSKLGDKQKSLEHFIKYTELKDSVFTSEKHQQIAEMQTKYDTERKEKEIALLNNQKIKKEAELQQQKTITFSFAAGLTIAIVFIVIIIMQFKQKMKAYNKLVQKSAELVNRNKQDIKYEKSNLDKRELNDIVNKLTFKIEHEKIFLDSKLSIVNLSKQLDTNSSYLSQVINTKFNLNFNNYINKHRINEAQILLADDKNNKYTIEAIASKVGFSNKSTFNKAFKTATGVTPSFYKKSLQNVEVPEFV